MYGVCVRQKAEMYTNPVSEEPLLGEANVVLPPPPRPGSTQCLGGVRGLWVLTLRIDLVHPKAWTTGKQEKEQKLWGKKKLLCFRVS